MPEVELEKLFVLLLLFPLKKKLGFIIIFENVEGTATAVSASRIPKGLLLFASC